MTPKHISFQLHNALIERHAAIHCSKQPKSSFAADIGGLDCRSVLHHSQERENAPLRKIGMAEQTAGIANDGTKLQVNRFKILVEPSTKLRLKRAQEQIAVYGLMKGRRHAAIQGFDQLVGGLND